MTDSDRAFVVFMAEACEVCLRQEQHALGQADFAGAADCADRAAAFASCALATCEAFS